MTAVESNNTVCLYRCRTCGDLGPGIHDAALREELTVPALGALSHQGARRLTRQPHNC